MSKSAWGDIFLLIAVLLRFAKGRINARFTPETDPRLRAYRAIARGLHLEGHNNVLFTLCYVVVVPLSLFLPIWFASGASAARSFIWALAIAAAGFAAILLRAWQLSRRRKSASRAGSPSATDEQIEWAEHVADLGEPHQPGQLP